MLHCNYFIPNCSTTTHQRAQLNLGGYSRSSQVTSMVQTPNTNPAEELCMHSKSMMSKIKHIVWPQVILFGDSITQFSFQANGWGAEIADKLARKCDVVNRGLSGYNTRWAKIVLPRLIPSAVSSHLAAVTVFFGANDCALEDKNPQQHVPLQEYSENLKDISQYLTSIGVPKEKVIFITPPPLHDADWEKQCLLKGCALNRTNAVAGQYAQACVKSAGQCGAEVLDLWTLMQKDGQDITVYLSDGLHLSEKGNQFVAQHLWRLLETRVNHLPFILPYWGDVDPKSPESCLLSDGPQGDPSATEGQH